jgi:16S rRNA processing protein RimM
MEFPGCIQIAYIVKTHGFKGELSLHLLVEKEYLHQLGGLLIKVQEKLVPYEVELLNLRANQPILKLKGIDTVEQAQFLKGSSLFAKLSDLPLPSGKNFFDAEIVGFKMIDKSLGEVGTIEEVQEYPHQKIFSVIKGNKEVLIPVVEAFIEKIDRLNKQIHVNVPEGLIDLYLSDSSVKKDDDLA